MQSLVVASLTLTVESASTSTQGDSPDTDTNAPVLQYLAHCFALVRLECEVPKPPAPADTYGGFPGFVWTGDDAPYSGRLDVQWERPLGPCVGFDGGRDLGADADRSLYRSRPRRYQLWCERSIDVVQGALNQLRQLGVDDFLEPSAIGLGRHVMEVESEEEIINAKMVGQSEGLDAGTKYSMAVRSWLNPPPGCATAWSKWSDWSPIGCTSPTHHVVANLRCVAASEHGISIAWTRPKLALHGSNTTQQAQAQVQAPRRTESWELGAFESAEPESEPEPEPEYGAIEWEYEVRMERTGARQVVQTLQAKVTGTIKHLFTQAGAWQQDDQASRNAATDDIPRPVGGDQDTAIAPSHSGGLSGAGKSGPVAPVATVAAEIAPPPLPNVADEPTLGPGELQSRLAGAAGTNVGFAAAPAVGVGVWDAVGGDRTKQMEVQHRLEAAEHSEEKLEAALLEASTILPDEHAVIRGNVLSDQLSVTCCAGDTVAAATLEVTEQGSHGQHSEHVSDADADDWGSADGPSSVLLRAASRELEALEPGVTYRVSVRARPCIRPSQVAAPGNSSSLSPDAPSHGRQESDVHESEWGGWCPKVDMQTLPAAWNPPPTLESPIEGWEVTVGEGCQISWSWPVAAAATTAPSHVGHARVAVTEILFTSQSGFQRYSIPLPAKCDEQAQADADSDEFSWDWNGRLWPSAMPDAPDSQIYIDSASPPPFAALVYLRFIGVDGMETYTSARRLLMTYRPLLQINAPPCGQRVPDYSDVGAAEYETESRGGRDDAVASATAGDPVEIRWEMMQGVTVSHITLNKRSDSWLSSLSTLASSTPINTIATTSTTKTTNMHSSSEEGTNTNSASRQQSEPLTPTCTSYRWNGRLPVTIVNLASAETPTWQQQEHDQTVHQRSKNLAGAPADDGVLDFIEEASQAEGAVPTGGHYDIVVHCVSPPELGGAKHGVRVPIDLDEPFEMVNPPPSLAILAKTGSSATAATTTNRGVLPAEAQTEEDCARECTNEHVQVKLPLSPGSRPLHI